MVPATPPSLFVRPALQAVGETHGQVEHLRSGPGNSTHWFWFELSMACDFLSMTQVRFVCLHSSDSVFMPLTQQLHEPHW